MTVVEPLPSNLRQAMHAAVFGQLQIQTSPSYRLRIILPLCHIAMQNRAHHR